MTLFKNPQLFSFTPTTRVLVIDHLLSVTQLSTRITSNRRWHYIIPSNSGEFNLSCWLSMKKIDLVSGRRFRYILILFKQSKAGLIQNYLSPRLVTWPKLKNPVYSTIYPKLRKEEIDSCFSKVICTKLYANDTIHDLSSSDWFHF